CEPRALHRSSALFVARARPAPTSTFFPYTTLFRSIDTRRADEIGDLLKAMQRMQRDLRERIERDQAVASENLRIRTALDSSGTCVMIATPAREVIYANQAVVDLLHLYQDSIQDSLPELDASQLVGASLDDFRHES